MTLEEETGVLAAVVVVAGRPDGSGLPGHSGHFGCYDGFDSGFAGRRVDSVDSGHSVDLRFGSDGLGTCLGVGVDGYENRPWSGCYTFC